jgi:hypothetical protein
MASAMVLSAGPRFTAFLARARCPGKRLPVELRHPLVRMAEHLGEQEQVRHGLLESYESNECGACGPVLEPGSLESRESTGFCRLPSLIFPHLSRSG